MIHINVDWDALTAISTTILVIVGAYQIWGIRTEAKKERTLAICNRYYSDIVLDNSVRRFEEARASGAFKKSGSGTV